MRNHDDNTHVVYSDSRAYDFHDTPSLRRYYCGECGFEFTAEDGDHCPACGSDYVVREH